MISDSFYGDKCQNLEVEACTGNHGVRGGKVRCVPPLAANLLEEDNDVHISSKDFQDTTQRKPSCLLLPPFPSYKEEINQILHVYNHKTNIFPSIIFVLCV